VGSEVRRVLEEGSTEERSEGSTWEWNQDEMEGKEGRREVGGLREGDRSR